MIKLLLISLVLLGGCYSQTWKERDLQTSVAAKTLRLIESKDPANPILTTAKHYVQRLADYAENPLVIEGAWMENYNATLKLMETLLSDLPVDCPVR